MNYEQIFDLFEQHEKEIFFENDIAKCNAEVYNNIANQLSTKTNKVTARSIYFVALRRFKGKIVTDYGTDDDETDSEYIPLNEAISSSDIVYNFGVSSQFFARNNPEIANDLVGTIWNLVKVPCNWIFRRFRKCVGEIVGSAKCSDCHNRLCLYTINGMRTVQFIIKQVGEPIEHRTKRRTIVKNVDIEQMLKTATASVVRKDLANQMMEVDDPEPAHLKSANALAIQRHRNNATCLNQDPITAIRLMKDFPEYAACIGDIGMDPFFVSYATPTQSRWFREVTRRKRVVISLDATGINVKRPNLSSRSHVKKGFKPIFLYMVTAQTENRSLPITQLLTQRHTADHISERLKEWRKTHFNNRKVDEAIMDDSKALTKAVIMTMTHFRSMKKYLDRCYGAQFEEKGPPDCYIRLDRSHIVHNIMKLKFMNKMKKRDKIFFQRILGYLITIEDVKNVEGIVERLFILIHNKYLSDPEVLEAREFLTKLSNSHILPFVSDNKTESENHIESEHESCILTKKKNRSLYHKWFSGINERVIDKFAEQSLNISEENGDRSTFIQNPFYSPDIADGLVDFLEKLPLCSSILNGVFGSRNTQPTSSPTEVQFKNIKASITTENGLRVDKFVQRNINQLQGEMKLAIAKDVRPNLVVPEKQPTIKDKRPKRKMKDIEENWKNKNEDIKPPVQQFKRVKRGRNSILNPTDSLLNHSDIPLLSNGNIVKEKGLISASNTCAFDSLFQVFAAQFSCDPTFADKVQKDDSVFSNFIKDVFSGEKSNYDIYSKRAEILFGLTPEKNIKNCTDRLSIDAENSVNAVLMGICEQSPLFNSMKTELICENCHSVVSCAYSTFLRTAINNVALPDIQSSILPPKRANKHCSVCKGRLKNRDTYNDLVSIDIEGAKIDLQAVEVRNENSISQKIVLNGYDYDLKGAIQIIEGPGTHHFVGHFKTSEWTGYDDMIPFKTKKTPKKINLVLVFYSKIDSDHTNTGKN